jgi:hypothetical protein
MPWSIFCSCPGQYMQFVIVDHVSYALKQSRVHDLDQRDIKYKYPLHTSKIKDILWLNLTAKVNSVQLIKRSLTTQWEVTLPLAGSY